MKYTKHNIFDFIDIPNCFISDLNDCSWGNDVLPSYELFTNENNPDHLIKVWVDHTDPNERECSRCKYVVMFYNHEQETHIELLDTDSLSEVLAFKSDFKPYWPSLDFIALNKGY